MTAYELPAFDPGIIERYVENTYRKATAVFLGSVVAGVMIGAAFGAMPLTSLGAAWPIPRMFGFATMILGAIVGGVVGYLIGDTRAFLAKLQGQTALAQIHAANDARLALVAVREIQALATRRAVRPQAAAPAAPPAARLPAAEPAPVSPSPAPPAPAPVDPVPLAAAVPPPAVQAVPDPAPVAAPMELPAPLAAPAPAPVEVAPAPLQAAPVPLQAAPAPVEAMPAPPTLVVAAAAEAAPPVPPLSS